MSKSLIFGLIGLCAVVALVLFVRRDGPSTDSPAMVQSRASTSSSAKADPMRDEGRPKSLGLGQPASGGAKDDSEQPGGGKNPPSKADLNRYRQMHRSTVNGEPRHGAGEGGDDTAPGITVKSQIDEPAQVGEGGDTRSLKERAAEANAKRAVVDDLALVNPDADPANAREPEPGEVLTLFEGDAVTSQTEASVAKNVALDENTAEFTPESEYAVPMAGKLTGDSGTLSFWVKPNGETSSTDNASLVQLRSQYEWNNRIQVWKDGSNIRMVFADGTGVETGATYGSDAWPDDEWRQVTVTWGDRMNAMYVNGQLSGTAQYEGGFQILPKTLLHVGSTYPDSPSSLNGSVSSFRVYNRALTPDEVGALPQQYPE